MSRSLNTLLSTCLLCRPSPSPQPMRRASSRSRSVSPQPAAQRRVAPASGSPSPSRSASGSPPPAKKASSASGSQSPSKVRYVSLVEENISDIVFIHGVFGYRDLPDKLTQGEFVFRDEIAVKLSGYLALV